VRCLYVAGGGFSRVYASGSETHAKTLLWGGTLNSNQRFPKSSGLRKHSGQQESTAPDSKKEEKGQVC